jgi:hypothetical protein
MKTMTTRLARILPLIVLVGLSGCTVMPTPAPDVLTGRYAGTLPCADCDGIRLVLELYEKTADGPPTRYTLERTYLGTPDGDRIYIEVGEWTILLGSGADPDATVYQLDPGKPGKTQSFLQRGDRELVLLDQELGEIQSALPDTLTRVP